MWDIFKGFFGIPPTNFPKTSEVVIARDDTQNSYGAPQNNVFNDNNILDNPPFGTFPVFTDIFKIHKFIEREMEHMLESFGGVSESFQCEGPECPRNEPETSLRDSVLKPGFNHDRVDANLDDRIETRDIDTLFRSPSASSSNTHRIQPNFYFESVRTIQHPDGRRETVRTVRDHEGREETTVTHEGPSHRPSLPPTPPFGGGASPFNDENIFSKFF